MRGKDDKDISMLQAIFKVVPLTCTAEPASFFIFIINSILYGVSFATITIFTQRFFDSATLFAEQKVAASVVVKGLLILGLAYIANRVFNGVNLFLWRVQGRKVQAKLTLDINKKMGRLAPVFFEDTKLLDDIVKANEGMNNSVWFSMTFLTTFTFYMPYLGFMGYYLYLQKPILSISIILAFLPMAIAQLFRSKIFMKLTDETAPIKRKFEYYNECISGREYFKETRLLGAWSYFGKLYKDTLKLLNKLRMKAYIKANLFELAMKFLTAASYACILYLLFDSVMKRDISIGVFAAVFASMGRLFSLMRELVIDQFTHLTQDLGTIVNYLRFLQIPERVGEDMLLSDKMDIEFNNVSFKYPQTDKEAVSNISFKIKDKETIAIVGENGSGKSTIIRLLTGLYKPTAGDVLISGVNNKDISMKSLYSKMSAVFQKYQKYKLTLKENIVISESNRSVNDKELDQLAGKAGFSKEEEVFVDGYDTMLSREFDGVDLSGGQWQRIAIARGYFRTHNLIILDEPTAAIDPVEETRVYNQFAEICCDKTAVIVTHRIGSAKIANRILVMNRGKLVEAGTHDELMKLDGVYAKMYCSQQKWYL